MKKNNYLSLLQSMEFLVADLDDEISVLANVTALIKQSLEGFSWVGFYILKKDTLHLGPFQGKVACSKISVGRGVCGQSVSLGKTILVKNVHEFPDHIACDSSSNSEIVIPIFVNGKIYGVLDIDSTRIGRFTNTDKIFLEKIIVIVSSKLEMIFNNKK